VSTISWVLLSRGNKCQGKREHGHQEERLVHGVLSLLSPDDGWRYAPVYSTCQEKYCGVAFCLKKGRILLANSNQWYFNSLVKKPCHKTHCRCPHRLNLSFQSSRSCALPNIKVLKDKDLEFANSIIGVL
jgi:hypothetical protein